MKTIRTTQKRSKKIPLIIAISIIAALTLGYFGYAYTTKNAWPFIAQQTESETVKPEGDINYNPPTDQEVEDSQEGKKNSGNQETNTDTGSIRTVSVAVAYAGYDDDEGAIDIRAFTSGVVEGIGTCTATLSKDGKVITRTSKAFVDSSSSQCEPILINVADFPSKGTWNLVVSYSSDTSKGSSSTMKVEVSR